LSSPAKYSAAVNSTADPWVCPIGNGVVAACIAEKSGDGRATAAKIFGSDQE
jgi:hypothetical protein